jgi:acrylyl-CoA reductase (NADPH)
MEINGQKPSMGPVVVTGATGGVGSLAIDMLAAKGYEVVALTGKAESEPYLRALGATQLLARSEISAAKQPLESARWGGAIDNCGGDTLAWLLRGMHDGGNVASIGLAASGELHTTVMPFILRGVSLLGVNSSGAPRDIRMAVWARLSTDLKPRHLDRIVTRNIDLKELPAAFESYIKGSVIGRTVVRIAPVAA